MWLEWELTSFKYSFNSSLLVKYSSNKHFVDCSAAVFCSNFHVFRACFMKKKFSCWTSLKCDPAKSRFLILLFRCLFQNGRWDKRVFYFCTSHMNLAGTTSTQTQLVRISAYCSLFCNRFNTSSVQLSALVKLW